MSRKLYLIIIQIILVFFILWFQISNLHSIKTFRTRTGNLAYDAMLNTRLIKNRIPVNQVAIIDIDDKSLSKEGRWPWPRDRVALLVEKLRQLGTVVIAFDITFTHAESNIAESLIQKIQNQPVQNTFLIQNIKTLIPQFNNDVIFANALKTIDCILGIIFETDDSESTGKLPTPLLTFDPSKANQLLIPRMMTYRANLPLLQEAAKYGGFTTTIPDSDGIIRRTPLLIEYKNQIYPSLALEAVRRYFLLDKIDIEFTKIGPTIAVGSIRLGSIQIDTDSMGQVIIPYAGPARTFKYISAVDVLHDKISPDQLKNRIAIIGTSAQGMADLHATPLQAVFPGIEIQSNVIAGLLKGQFPYRPIWAEGAELVLSLITALLLILILPFFRVFGITIISLLTLALLIVLNVVLWHSKNIVLIITTPFITVVTLTIVNFMYGFFFEYRRRQQLKTIFGQYVPPSRVEIMSQGAGQSALEGESRELTVLFADIINFTRLSESLSASEVKNLLNQFFTPLTKIIFEYHGTIDKYMGDMIMAFWGAPIPDDDHAKHALEAALAMRDQQKQMKETFLKYNLPSVQMGIGINTGIMNVGDMGSKFRLAYTVLGDAVNLGSRIEQLTRHYKVDIAVGEQTYKNQSDFVFRKLDRVRVKGKIQPVELYELICSKKDATPEIYDEVAKHEEALNYYFQQNWTTAKTLFEQLRQQYPDTYLYQLFIERIDYLMKHPPRKDWNGVYTWKVK